MSDTIHRLMALSELCDQAIELARGDRAIKAIFPPGKMGSEVAEAALKGNSKVAKRAMSGSAWSDQTVAEIRKKAAKLLKEKRANQRDWPKQYRRPLANTPPFY